MKSTRRHLASLPIATTPRRSTQVASHHPPCPCLASSSSAVAPTNGRHTTPDASRSHASRLFSSATPPRRAPPLPPAAGSSNVSTIMADEAQLGRHFYLNRALEHWASRPATKMTLRQLLFFGRSLGRDPDKILKSANYVREELPIRIAQRIRDMQNLPYVVMTNEHLEKVYQLYWKAFDRFRRWPVIRTHEDNEKYVALLKELLEEHLTVIPSLALGVVEVSDHLPPGQLEGFMQRMLKSRISRRVLAEQHIALTEALDDPFIFFSSDPSPAGPEHIGIIHTHLSVRSIIQECITLLTRIFAREAGLTPEEAIRTKAVPEMIVDGDLEAKISYIPEHISFIVFELIKDAMRAVMRYKPEERDEVALRATIVEGPPEDDMIIRISDCGGGVSDLVSRLADIPRSPGAVRPRNPAAGDADGSASLMDDGKHMQASSRISMATMPSTTVNKNTAIASSPSTLSPLSADYGSSSEPSSWPSGATSPVSMSSSSTLTDVLCSFSNVRRRLELEEEARRAEARFGSALQEGSPTEKSRTEKSPDSKAGPASPNASASLHSNDSLPANTTTSTLLGASAQAGLGSRSKLEHLRRVGKFKGTVGEQVVFSASPSSSPSSATVPPQQPSDTAKDAPPQPAKDAPPHPAIPAESDFRTSVTSTSLGLTDTGLGLPMARVYAEFFGGSLNFRSLDGHGQDVYVRVPKLGVVKEGGPGEGL